MRRGRALGLLWAALLLLPSAVSLPPALPPGPFPHASPYEAAFTSVEDTRTDDDLLPEPDFFTVNQMMGVLVWLHRAELFPARGDVHVAQARLLWEAAESAYRGADQYYYVTESPATCIRIDVNAWALLATQRLANATGEPGMRERANQLGTMLRSAVDAGQHNGVERCRTTVPSQWPLTLLALFEHARLSNRPLVRDAALARLAIESSADPKVGWWREPGAFLDPTGFFLLTTNAQYLLVLQEAAQLQPSGPWAGLRDELAATLQDESLQATADGLLGHDLEAIAASSAPILAPPVAQVWLAHALHHQQRAAPASITVGDAPDRLLDSLLEVRWSEEGERFADEGGAVTFETVAVIAWLTSGPSVEEDTVTVDNARLQWVIPANRSFSYPALSTPVSRNFQLLNEWIYRFQMDTVGPYPAEVALPLSRLGPLRLDLAPSEYAPPPRLFISSNVVENRVSDPQSPLLYFTINNNVTNLPIRFIAYAPVEPLFSSVARDVRVVFISTSDEPLNIDLVLDVAVYNVTVRSARFNDEIVAPGNYRAQEVGAAEFLNARHIRLTFTDLLVAAGTSELLVSVEDTDRPVFTGSRRLSRDAGGEQEIRTTKVEGRDVYRLPRQGNGFVRVAVQDNAALREGGVTLVVQDSSGGRRVPMEPDAATPGWYVGRFPELESTAPVTAYVEAVDEQFNIAQSASFDVQTQPLLEQTEIVLLVFSGTLFAVAIVIYARMGRRRRAQ